MSASYNWTDIKFTCNGHIRGLELCNRMRIHINLGLSLWKKDKGVLDTRVMYSERENSLRIGNQMNFNIDDQVMFIVINPGPTSNAELKYVIYINTSRSCNNCIIWHTPGQGDQNDKPRMQFTCMNEYSFNAQLFLATRIYII